MIVPLAISVVLFPVAGLIAIARQRLAAIVMMMLWPALATAIFVALRPAGAPMSQNAIEALKEGFAWSCVVCHCIALAEALTGSRGRA